MSLTRCEHCRGFHPAPGVFCARCTRLMHFGKLVEVLESWVRRGSRFGFPAGIELDWEDALDAVAYLLIAGARERAAARRDMNETIQDGQREAGAAFEDGRLSDRGDEWHRGEH